VGERGRVIQMRTGVECVESHELLQRSMSAAAEDLRMARVEFDDASGWLEAARVMPREPLAAEVWVFDAGLCRVLLVRHRWRGWVPPGGKVEPGEIPRAAARRELFEETGLDVRLLARPAVGSVRSYHPDWPATLGLSYVAIADSGLPLKPEHGQPAAWRIRHASVNTRDGCPLGVRR
jgi:8-oxo-dGTP diphosphatase